MKIIYSYLVFMTLFETVYVAFIFSILLYFLYFFYSDYKSFM